MDADGRVPQGAAEDAAAAFARHIAGANVGQLQDSTLLATRRDILDTLGCMVGGRGEPGIAALVDLVAEWGGRPEAPVITTHHRVPAHHAAMVNGAMAHALDFDDTHDLGCSIHPGAPVLAAALAAAALRGRVSGSEFLLAVALGLDVACRIALAAPEDRGWHRTAAIGVFGAATAAARLLGLDAGRIEHALGIALSQAAGTRQCIDDGALTKRFQAGHAASAGVLSAVLASRGLTGARAVFSGRYGFLPMYQPGEVLPGRLTESLGEVWEGDQVSLKPYPCFRPSHPAIDAAILVHQELGLAEGPSIAGVMLETDARCHADQFEGGAHKRRPRHVVEAQFATPFLVATALRRGRVGIRDVSAPAEAAVLDLADRIQGRSVPGRIRGWARLTVRLVDGREASHEVERASGSPAKPMTDAAIDAKFRDCASHAPGAPAPDAVSAIIAFVRTLDRQEDVTVLASLLAAS